MASNGGAFERLRNLDRRWLFLVMGLAVVIPILTPLGLPATPSGPVVDVYDAVDGLKEGSKVFISMDFDPASTPELAPFARSVLVHLKRRHAKIIIATLWPYGPPLVAKYVGETLTKAIGKKGDASDPLNKIYERKTDYVFLGFKDGKNTVINNMGQSIPTQFPTDYEGEPLSAVPIMQGIQSLQDFKQSGLLVLISAGQPGAKEYVQLLTRYSLPIVVSTTAVSKTELQPYYSSGQIQGLVAGMQGAAEYELLVDPPGMDTGRRGLDVLNIGTLVIILAIVLGNVIYFVEKRRPGGAQ